MSLWERATLIMVVPCTAVWLASAASPALADDSALDRLCDRIEHQFHQAIEKHDLALAEKLARQLIGLVPGKTQGYKDLANVQERRHEYEQAISTINKALKLEKDDVRCFVVRARLYSANDQDSLAKADHKKLISMDGLKPSIYTSEAFALERLGDLEDALTGVKKALKLGATDISTYKRAGEILEHLERPAEAEPYLKRVVALAPHESESYRHLAIIHTTLKQPKNVIDDTTGAINIGDVAGTRLVDTYRLRAQAYADLGRYREALSDYDQCLKISPLERRFFEARAAVEQKLGDRAGARRDLEKLKSLDQSIPPFNGF